jgi:hypothetical protein
MNNGQRRPEAAPAQLTKKHSDLDSDLDCGTEDPLLDSSDALRGQLAAIAGIEPATSYIEIRALGRDGRPATQAFVPVRQADDAIRRIGELATARNVFVGAAPRTRENGSAAAVDRVWCLWADLDGPEALERLDDFRPSPSLVIRTGSPDCAHAYWPLREPLFPHWAQRANRRLGLALRGDLAATDPARILRACGSLNHKHVPAREVLCTRLAQEAFSLKEVVGGLPDTDHYTPRLRTAGECHVTGDPSRLLAGLARTVADAQEGKRNCLLFWAACRVCDHARLGELDADEALAELHTAAARAGLPEFEIARTMRSAMTAGSP